MQMPDTIIGNMIAAKTAREMILVLPNCRARANDTYVADQFSLDNYRAFDNFINDLRDNLMPYIKENYSVAEGRENTAIAGFSNGWTHCTLYRSFRCRTLLDI